MSGKKTISFEQAAWRLAAGKKSGRDSRYAAARISLAQVLHEGVTPRQKQILLAYFFEGKRIPEIALCLGVNKSTVSRTLARGLRNINERMKYYRFG